MAAELNELFEEGITRCGELTDAVDAAMDAIDETTDQAREVAERVLEEGREARQHLRDLALRMDQAEESIGAARKDAEGSVHGLAGRTAELKTELRDLLERVKHAASQLETQKGRLDDSLDAHTATAQGDLAGLTEMTRELDSAASRRLDDAGQAIEGYRTRIEAAQAELAQKREAWMTALDRLATIAHQQTEVWVAGLQKLLQRQSTAMVAAVNVMVDRHNDTMDVIKDEFAVQAPQDAAAALEPLEASLRALGEEGSARLAALESRAGGLEAAMSGPTPILADLRAALEATTELG